MRELLSIHPTAKIANQRTMHDVKDDPVNVVFSKQHDLKAALADLAQERSERRSERLHWQQSVVDLLKLLDLNSEPQFREWLADTLQIRAGPIGSTPHNIALYEAVIQELAAAELEWKGVTKFRSRNRRCLNCGDANHREYNCEADCGKCTATASVYSSSIN